MHKHRKSMDLSLAIKMMIIITAVCLGLSVGNFLILKGTYQAYDEQLYISTAQVFTSVVEQVDMQFAQIDTVTLAMATNAGVKENLNILSQSAPGSEAWLRSRSNLVNDIRSYMYGVNVFYSFCIVMADGETVGSLDEASVNERKEVAALAEAGQGRPLVICQNGNVYYTRQLQTTELGESRLLGTMIARINTMKLYNDCVDVYKNADIPLELNVLVDGVRIYPYGDPDLQAMETDGWEIQGDLFVVQCTAGNGWKYLIYSSYDTIHRTIRLTQLGSFGLTVCIAVLALVCSSFLVKRSTRHLNTLMEKIDAYRDGVLPERKDMEIYQHRRDEFGRLHRHFDRMAYDNKRLNDENYQRMLLQKEAQYKQLQQQIQPHFIFNTMSLITWIAYEHDDTEIAELSTALSRLLRTSMNMEPRSVPLREEIALVADYMHIQTTRFGNRLEYEMAVPQELMEVHIPQLSIQPLVENAIKYALEEMLDMCRIRILGRTEGNTAVLIVEDNGPGIDPQILQKLESNQIQPKGHGIGMQNIQKRIQLLFSEEYGLQVSRSDGKTQVCIRVPLEQ